jgi:hypothetical protein
MLAVYTEKGAAKRTLSPPQGCQLLAEAKGYRLIYNRTDLSCRSLLLSLFLLNRQLKAIDTQLEDALSQKVWCWNNF